MCSSVARLKWWPKPRLTISGVVRCPSECWAIFSLLIKVIVSEERPLQSRPPGAPKRCFLRCFLLLQRPQRGGDPVSGPPRENCVLSDVGWPVLPLQEGQRSTEIGPDISDNKNVGPDGLTAKRVFLASFFYALTQVKEQIKITMHAEGKVVPKARRTSFGRVHLETGGFRGWFQGSF